MSVDRGKWSKRIEQGVPVLILLWFFGLATSIAILTPVFEAPDELAHFLYIHNLKQTGELPTLFANRDEVFASQATHRHHPPLYYMLGAVVSGQGVNDNQLASYRHPNPFAAIGTVTDNNQQIFLSPVTKEPRVEATIFQLRLLSVFLGTLTVALVYRIGKTASGKRAVGLLAMILVANIPTFLFISASINNDNLVTFFYTAGLCWLVERWQATKHPRKALTTGQMLLIGAVLAGMALTKVNGLSLFGLVFGGLWVGAALQRWSWKDAFSTLITAAVMAAVLAGWWYWRNFDLYGDPLALDFTSRIWGRGATAPSLSELEAVWLSFWAVLGQFNIRMDSWIYPYATFVSVLGYVGILGRVRRGEREQVLLLGTTILLVVASLLVATLRVNISQGRLLFPMLSAFAVLTVWGWIKLLRRPQWVILVLLPLVGAAWTTPAALRAAYRPLEKVDTLPSQYKAVLADAGPFYLTGFTVEPSQATPGEVLTVQVYFQVLEEDPYDYALSIAVLDRIRSRILGNAFVYPGNIATHELPPSDQIYRAEIQVRLDADAEPVPPYQLVFEFKWLRVIDEGNSVQVTDSLTWRDGTSQEIGNSVVLPALTWVDPRYHPPRLQETANQAFGNVLVLESYRLSTNQAQAGELIQTCFVWRPTADFDEDWHMTLQLLDTNGNLVINQDGSPSGYPSSSWVARVSFEDCRDLQLPDNLSAGTYSLFVGWYHGETRLSVAEGLSNLFRLQEITIARAGEVSTP